MKNVLDQNVFVQLVQVKKMFFHVIDRDVVVNFVLFDMYHLLIALVTIF
jgi:hypothetical protein